MLPVGKRIDQAGNAVGNTAAVENLIRCNKTGVLLFGQPERSIVHFERFEDPLLEEFLEGDSADLFDNRRAHVNSEIAVTELGTGIREKRNLDHRRGERTGGKNVDPEPVHGRRHEPEPGHVRHDLPHGRFRFRGADGADAIFAALFDPEILKFRQIGFDRRVQIHQPLIDQDHQSGGDHSLGHRSDPVNTVERSRGSAFDIGVTGRLNRELSVFIGGNRNESGKDSLINVRLNRRRDRILREKR